MKSLFYSAIAMFVMAAAISGCSSNSNERMEQAADDLYHKSANITRLYIDSLSNNAVDSADVIRLDKGLESRLTELNYMHPAGAYLEISQGQNDTLARLTDQFVVLRDSLLYKFGHPELLAPADSIAADSIVPQPKNNDK